MENNYLRKIRENLTQHEVNKNKRILLSSPENTNEFKAQCPNSSSMSISSSNKQLSYGLESLSTVSSCKKKKLEEDKNLSQSNKALLSADISLLETIGCCYEVKKKCSQSNNKKESVITKDDFLSYSQDKIKSLVEDLEAINDGENDEMAWDMSTTINEDEVPTECNSFTSRKNGFGLSGLETDIFSDQSMLEIIKESEEVEKALNDNDTSYSALMSKGETITPNKIKNQQFMKTKSCSSNLEPNENLFFGLPSKVKQLIKKYKGIENLYAWQEECLNLPAIKSRKNLVYSLPTSGGKTLVAEILILQELLSRKKDVLFVLPYVSIAQEKVRALSPFAVDLRFLVEEYAGSRGNYPPKKRKHVNTVYIATIEKGLGLVHSLLENGRLNEVGLAVIDELHLIGEDGRGANLESLLVKLLCYPGNLQVVAMSATIGNIDEIAKFLRAETYSRDFRPVELTEYIKVNDEMFVVDHKPNNPVPLTFHSNLKFPYSQEMKQTDPDQIGGLVNEVVPEHSCLVFCHTKLTCENIALLVCKILNKKILEHKLEEKKALYHALRMEGNGAVCQILSKTLPFGVAYHHSGLTMAERVLLEEAFLAKTLCCICCTSTLAAGVNLPAKRVILRSPYIGNQFMSFSKYKQMIGRAGRAGLGETGESILVCKPSDTQKVAALMTSSIENCNSQIDDVALSDLVLSAIHLSITRTDDDLLEFFDYTLLTEQSSHTGIDIKSKVRDALNSLIELEGVKRTNSFLHLTSFGRATAKGNFDLKTAKVLYADLKIAQNSLVLSSYLHLLFLVTPYSMLAKIRIEKDILFDSYFSLGPKELQAANVLGVTERSIVLFTKLGGQCKIIPLEVMQRFYLSLILFDLWNQKTVWEVSAKYNIARGAIHSFLNTASAFASSVLRFCEELDELWCFKHLLRDFPNRIIHCSMPELLPLMDLPAVKIGRAKQLFNAGYETISLLARANPKTLVHTIDHLPRKIAHQIVAAAKLLILAKAESLQEEAEEVLVAINGDNPKSHFN